MSATTIIRMPSRILDAPLGTKDYARNGRAVAAPYGRAVLGAYNQVLCHQRKMVFSKALHLGSLYAASASQQSVWYAHCRTGYKGGTDAGALQLRFDMLLAPAAGVGSSDPRVWWTVNGTATEVVRVPLCADDLCASLLIPATIRYTVDPLTTYNLVCLTEDNARVCGCSVYEEHATTWNSESVAGSNGTLCVAREPLITTAQEQLLFNGHSLWLANASPLISWSQDYASDTARPSRMTNTYANAFDQTVTTVLATSPGWSVETAYRSAEHTDDIACTWAVYGYNHTSAGGGVKLVDSSGDLGELTSFSTSGEWKTATVNLDASLGTHKVDLHIKGDGTHIFHVYAMALYPIGA